MNWGGEGEEAGKGWGMFGFCVWGGILNIHFRGRGAVREKISSVQTRRIIEGQGSQESACLSL